MKRSILACLAGLLTWVVVVSVINRMLRLTLPGYSTAEHTLQFTLAMKWARLAMAFVSSVIAGSVTAVISRPNRWAPFIVGIVVLAMFVPLHIAIWSKFPVWYHLTFLLTIIPAVVLGALLPSRRNRDLGKVNRDTHGEDTPEFRNSTIRRANAGGQGRS